MDDEIDDGALLNPSSLPFSRNTGRRQTMPTQCEMFAPVLTPSAIWMDRVRSMSSPGAG